MSQPSASPDASTEDRRILDELEQLRQAIRSSRVTRERAEAAFDSELRAFEPPVRLPSAAPAVAASTGPANAGSSSAAASVPPRLTLPKPNPSPAVALFDDEASPLPAPPRSRKALIVGGIAVVVFASAGYVMTSRRGPEGGDRPAAVVQPQAVASPPEEVGAATKPGPGDPHALRVDLTSLRRVWLRVSVDGRIALEREVAAGEQLPFGADRSIVVRAGDAGAVTVRVGPDDQGTLGRDGQVVTRAFNLPGR